MYLTLSKVNSVGILKKNIRFLSIIELKIKKIFVFNCFMGRKINLKSVLEFKTKNRVTESDVEEQKTNIKNKFLNLKTLKTKKNLKRPIIHKNENI